MELDDLKHTWKQAERTQQPQNNNIMELIQNKSYGPIAALKKSFRRQAILMPLVLAIVINNLSLHHQLLTNVLFWSYVVFCIGMCIFFYLNYRLVLKMECMDSRIKPNIERQVEILEKRLKWHITALRIGWIFFIVLLEVMPYFQPGSMLTKWHAVSPVIRMSVYVALLIFQHFAAPALSKRKYGNHLAYLKKLISEME